MISAREASERASRGARLLDEKGPEEWAIKIDTIHLDVRYPEKCILGQLYGGYGKGLRAVGSPPYVDYGFDCHSDDNDVLVQAWLVEIQNRLEQEEPDTPLLNDLVAEPSVFSESESETLDMEAFIREHGANLEKMYTNRTAGDYSFTGFVVSVLLDLQRKGVQIPF